MATASALGAFRIARETSYGIPPAAPTWVYPVLHSEGLESSPNPIERPGIIGRRTALKPALGPWTVEGATVIECGPETVHRFVEAALSRVAITQPNITTAPNTYQHVFTTATTQGSYVMDIERNWTGVQALGCVAAGVTFNVREDDVMMCSTDWAGRSLPESDMNFTPTLSALDPFTYTNGSIQIGGVAFTEVDDWEVRVETGSMRRRRFGDKGATEYIPGQSRVLISPVMSPATDTEWRRFLGSSVSTGRYDPTATTQGTQLQPLDFRIICQTGEYRNILAYPYRCEFRARLGVYRVFPSGIPGNSEIMRANPVIMAYYNPTDNTDLAVTIINGLSSI